MDAIRNSLACHLSSIPRRLKNVASEYVLMASTMGGNASLQQASSLSGIPASCFSNLLSKGAAIPVAQINHLASKLLTMKRRPLIPNSPWTVAIIVDSTHHQRSKKDLENVQKFSKGGKYIVGHQWTNIMILTGGQRIPLPPIPFYTKEYCSQHNLEYKSEPVRVREFLEKLRLEDYIGNHRASEVVVLLDSGYDSRDLQQTILMNGWDLIGSLKSSSTVKIEEEAKKQKLKTIFSPGSNHIWQTVYRFDSNRKRRKDFRTCATTGFLNGLVVEGQIVCSELRRDRLKKETRKYLYCSNVSLDLGVIVRLYSERWKIEVFHKDMKSQMGMEKNSL